MNTIFLILGGVVLSTAMAEWDNPLVKLVVVPILALIPFFVILYFAGFLWAALYAILFSINEIHRTLSRHP